MDRNDLISREALKRHITEIFEREEKIDKKWAMGLKYSLKLIDNAPTVEYPFYQEAYQTGYEEGKNERPQGEWKCPECGEGLFACPNCGADMRQDNEPDKQITIEEYMQSLKGEN